MADSKKRQKGSRTVSKPISSAFNDGFESESSNSSVSKHENDEISSDDDSFFSEKVYKKADNLVRKGDGNLQSLRQQSNENGKPLLKKRKVLNETSSVDLIPMPLVGDDSDGPNIFTEKKHRHASETYVQDQEVKYELEIPWVEKYQPNNTSQVALHARKKNEVMEVIETVMRPKARTRVLILSGPAGTSKSTILKTAFIERYQKKYGNDMFPDIVQYETPDSRRDLSLVRHFTEFLAGCRYRGNNQNAMIIVEDLPNIAHFDTKREFNRAIADWIYRSVGPYEAPPPCLAIIITEVEAANDADLSSRNALSRYSNPSSIITECMLVPQILNHPQLRRIKFNKIAKTIAKKALKSIAEQEKRLLGKVSATDLTKVLDMLSTYGDIRSSISTFDFWTKSLAAHLQYGHAAKDNGLSSGNKKAKFQQTIDFYFNLMKHDSSLDIFHAVGKVVYRSMKDKDGNVVTDPDIVVNSIIDDWGKGSRGDQQSLENLLFENYLSFNSESLSVENVLQCLESLDIGSKIASNTGMFTSGGALATELALEIEVRGIRYALASRDRLKSSFQKLNAPRFLSIKKNESALKFQERIADLQQRRTRECKTTVNLDPLIQYENFYMGYIENQYQRTGKFSKLYDVQLSETDETDEFDSVVNTPNVKGQDNNELQFSDDLNLEDFEDSDQFDDLPSEIFDNELQESDNPETANEEVGLENKQKDISLESTKAQPVTLPSKLSFQLLTEPETKPRDSINLSDDDLNDSEFLEIEAALLDL